jgi:hypothetical protein
VRGPDFPTGGVISGRDGILSYLKTGKGIVRTRGKAHTEELKGGMEQIVITEIPYNVNRHTSSPASPSSSAKSRSTASATCATNPTKTRASSSS